MLAEKYVSEETANKIYGVLRDMENAVNDTISKVENATNVDEMKKPQMI